MIIVSTSIKSALIAKIKKKVDDLLLLLNDDKISAKTIKVIPTPIIPKNKSKKTAITVKLINFKTAIKLQLLSHINLYNSINNQEQNTNTKA